MEPAVRPSDENKTYLKHSLRHPRAISTQTDTLPPEICRLFTKGKCTWGDKCHRLHPSRLGPHNEDPSGPPPYSSAVAVQGEYGGGHVLGEQPSCPDDKSYTGQGACTVPKDSDPDFSLRGDDDAGTSEVCSTYNMTETGKSQELCELHLRRRCTWGRRCRRLHVNRAQFRLEQLAQKLQEPAPNSSTAPLPPCGTPTAEVLYEPYNTDGGAELRDMLRSLQSGVLVSPRDPDIKFFKTPNASDSSSTSLDSRDPSSSPSRYGGWADSYSDVSTVSSGSSSTVTSSEERSPDRRKLDLRADASPSDSLDSSAEDFDHGIVIRLPALDKTQSPLTPRQSQQCPSKQLPHTTYADSALYSVKLPPRMQHLRRQTCWAWQRGRCKWENCKFLHEQPVDEFSSRDAGRKVLDETPCTEPCWEWLAGRCQRINCKYSHRPEDVRTQLISDQNRAPPATKDAYIQPRMDSDPLTTKSTPVDECISGVLSPRRPVAHHRRRSPSPPSHISGAAPARAAQQSTPSKAFENSPAQITSVKTTRDLPPAEAGGENHLGSRLHRYTCWAWLRGGCPRGDACKYPHGTTVPTSRLPLSADSEDQTGTGASHLSRESSRPHATTTRPFLPRMFLKFSVLGARVTFGPGFFIEDVHTTVDMCSSVVLGELPSGTTQAHVYNAVKWLGGVEDIKLVTSTTTSGEARTTSAHISFLHHSNATQAAAVLDGTSILGQPVSARLPTSVSLGQGSVQNQRVELEWDAPETDGFAGYATRAQADVVIAAANGAEIGGNIVRAALHSGLPTLGPFTVRFANLPANARMTQRKYFGRPEGTMVRKPKYTLSTATAEIVRLIARIATPEDADTWTVEPPPYRDGLVRASMVCASAAAARTIAATFDGCNLECLGDAPIRAYHIHTVSYRIPKTSFRLLADDISALSDSAAQNRCSVRVLDPDAEEIAIEVVACSPQALRLLTGRLNLLLRGEVISLDGVPVWDDHFFHSGGFFAYLGHNYPSVLIQRDMKRRTIKLFGPSSERAAVANQVVTKVEELQNQERYTFPLQGPVIAFFMKTELAALDNKLGRENVWLDRSRRILTIRGGGEHACQLTRDAISRAETRYVKRSSKNKNQDCSVCFSDADDPIRLPCGHSWCRTCLQDYLSSPASQSFPLTCLGADAKCGYAIPITLAQEILPKRQFDETCTRAFTTYIRARPSEFALCPTPDCLHVYRTLPGARNERATVQCPTCLVRICAHCRVEAHDEMRCEERGEQQEVLFKQWTAAHDVKPCPKCNAHIERTAGCNHMTCVVCKTHICWVCMETFPDGHVIYDHMRAVHGGIGL